MRAAGAVATTRGIGAALRATFGSLLIQKWGFNASFAELARTGSVERRSHDCVFL
jgi:HD-like signal output (HDOD) protein